MLRFNKKTEYALLAIEHMVLKSAATPNNGVVSSVREISESYHIPFPVLAKVMQRLAGRGLIKATQGIKGGYQLAKQAHDISLADLVEVFDGPLAVAECFKKERISCPQWSDCTIKNPFMLLNQKIQKLLTETTIADLTLKHEGRIS